MTPFGYTIKEAAQYLGLKPTAVRSLIATRKLGCYRVGASGGRIRISPDQVAAYLESTRVDPAKPTTRTATLAVKLVPLPPVKDYFAGRKAK